MKKALILVRDWFKKQWIHYRPGKTTWKGISWGLIGGGCLFWVITQIVMVVPGMLTWVVLLNTLVPPLLILMGAALIHWLLEWLNSWPKMFRWAFIAALVLFSAPFALMVRFDKATVIGTVYLVITTALLCGIVTVLLKTNWNNLRIVKKIGMTTGLIVGIASIVFGMVWLLTPGGKNPENINAALVNIEDVQPMDLPNPSLPGPYTVKTLTYGSGTDLRRPEYGKEVDLISRSVDASPFVQGWKGFVGWVLRSYWGFDLQNLPLNGRIWYPVGDEEYPLVLVVHGNHRQEDFSDPGYAYLGEHLASRGMIVVSVDENFLNGTWTSLFNGEETKNENDARAWMLLEHLRLWKSWNQNEESPFYQKVDWNNLALIGHSRGGEAVAEAALFNTLPTYPDNAKIEFNYHYPIQAVIAIAPIDSQYNPGGVKTPLSDINYLVLHGSMDGDVSSFDGIGQYNRIKFTPDSDHYKAAVYIHGANHGQFNSGWGNSDSGPGLGAGFWNTMAMLPAVEQETTAKVFVSAFLETAFDKNLDYLEIFRDWRVAANWLPETIYLTQYNDSRYIVLADFEEDLNSGTTTLENGEIFSLNFDHWKESILKGKWNQDLSTSVVSLGWDNRTKGSFPAVYGINLPENSIQLNSQDYFVFSMGDTGEDPNTKNKELFPEVNQTPGINFCVELSSGNQKAVIQMDELMLLQPQIKVQLSKAGFMDKAEVGETILQRFYIPLNLLQSKNPQFKLEGINKIVFRFDLSPYGWVVLDDIGFWQEIRNE
ncbi:MAG: hypothetical protein CL609_05915 [Anaerolineaceae bacterium]|nr:hypothetical protein [Anaerolineaceae bacterium]